MSASKHIHYFSSQPATFGFWVIPPPDNTVLNAAYKNNNESLLNFQINIGTAAHTTLEMEQLISHMRTRTVNTNCLLAGF